MSHLRTRILLLLSAVAVAFLLAAWWIQDRHLLPSFKELERQHALDDLQRGCEALRNEIVFVGDFASDWSGWDDTYKFVEDRNPEFIASNLESDVFRETSFDFLSFVRLDGTEVWRGAMLGGEAIELTDLPTGQWPLTHDLLKPRDLEDVAKGIVVTTHGPLMIASRPITDSSRQAPLRGWIVMGRFLSAARLRTLRQQTRVDLAIVPVASCDGPRRLAAERLGQIEHEIVAAPDQLFVRSVVKGLRGDADAVLVEVTTPRSILAQGQRAMSFALTLTTIAVLLLFAVLTLVLQRIVIGPLQRLTSHALTIRSSGDMSGHSGIVRADEIGTLAREFDSMVARLAELQSRQVQQARVGGMAEIARTVLHDVGNALQPVHGNLGQLRRHLENRNLDDLQRVSSMLLAHTNDLATWLGNDQRANTCLASCKRWLAACRVNTPRCSASCRTLAKGSNTFSTWLAVRISTPTRVARSNSCAPRTCWPRRCA